MRERKANTSSFIVASLVLIMPSLVIATPIGMNPRWEDGQALRISASNSTEQAEILIPESSGVWIGDSWFYNMSRPVLIESDTGSLLGRIDRLLMVVSSSPQVSLNFLVIAGDADTHFLIESELLAFSSIPSATGRASAGITVTDLDGDGVHLQGAFGDSSHAYQSRINPGVGQTVFSELVENVDLGAGGSITSHGVFPSPVGVFSAMTQSGQPLLSADSMQSAFEFTLSANDVAGGTSVFALTVPEPCQAVLFGLSAALVGIRRRRNGR